MIVITVARKPLSENTTAENVLEWGTGGIDCHPGDRYYSNVVLQHLPECKVVGVMETTGDWQRCPEWPRKCPGHIRVNRGGGAVLREAITDWHADRPPNPETFRVWKCQTGCGIDPSHRVLTQIGSN